MELQFLEKGAVNVKVHDVSFEIGKSNADIGSIKLNIVEGHQNELHVVIFQISTPLISRS